MKKLVFGLLLLTGLLASPVLAATKFVLPVQPSSQLVSLQKQVKNLQWQLSQKSAPLVCDTSSLNNQVNTLQAKVTEYESYLQPMVTKDLALRTENEQLKSQVQQALNSTQQAITLSDNYKQMYLKAVGTQSAPVAPAKIPVMKCFYGTTSECFDLSTFPADLINQLNLIAQKPITMQSIAGDQLRAIHTYLGY